MKIAVTGYKGTIGSALIKRGYEPIKADILHKEELFDAVSNINPDVIIHCAALTDVEYCESNLEKAFDVNIRGTTNVADSFKGRLIYISSDHVFNGSNGLYTEHDIPDPVNNYGYTKWAGEALSSWGKQGAKSTVVRTSKIFDDAYIKEVVKLSKEKHDVPDFILRGFLYMDHFIEGLEYVVNNFRNLKLIHLAGTEVVSYYTFYRLIANRFGGNPDLFFPRKENLTEYAPRPFHGGLNCKLAVSLGIPTYSFRDAFK